MGNTWNHYAEDYPSPCYLGKSTIVNGKVQYSAHHNPWSYYSYVVNNECGQIQDIIKFNANALPTYCMVQPNNEHNGHTGDSTAAESDKWASTFIPQIINGPDCASTLLVIVWDNALPWPGVSPCIFVSPFCKGVGTIKTAYNHYNNIHTQEELLGLPTLTSNDASAAIMSDMFISSGLLDVAITVSSNPTVGISMSVTANATGGLAPYTYAWSNLPDGLTASNNSTITGTPTTAATYGTAVTVKDSGLLTGKHINIYYRIQC